MSGDDLVNFSIKLKRMREPFDVIKKMANGKTVLNVGAGGGVNGYLPNAKEIWLHEIIRNSSVDLVGIDVDSASIEYAKKYGYEILNENCETMALGRKFDLIVMSDVIEHVNAPVTAVNNLVAHLSDGGRLVITTPNATAGNIVVRSILRKGINVFADHMTVYYPEHFQAMCVRLHCQLKAVYVFDHVDRRSPISRLKSSFFQVMTMISPRLASSLLVIIEK